MVKNVLDSCDQNCQTNQFSAIIDRFEPYFTNSKPPLTSTSPPGVKSSGLSTSR